MMITTFTEKRLSRFINVTWSYTMMTSLLAFKLVISDSWVNSSRFIWFPRLVDYKSNIYMWCVARYGTTLKNVKNNYGGPLHLLKVTLLHGCFLRFLNCTNDTKSRSASQRYYVNPYYLLYEYLAKS